MFQKYHVVIFKDSSGTSSRFQISGATALMAVLLVVGLAIAAAFFGGEYMELNALRTKLAKNELSFEEQRFKLAVLTNKLIAAREDLNRIQIFDSKLRGMLSPDGDLQQISSARGGGESDSLSGSRLPLHRQDLMLRKLNAYLNRLASETRLEELNQQELMLALRHSNELLTTIPSVWPVEGFLTSRFGKRSSPFTGHVKLHKGIDIGAHSGTPVTATAMGKVIMASMDGAYGNSVVIDHGSGLSTRYAHLKRILVSKGQTVNRGDQIGQVGNTGRSSGPHLHYEVRINNVPVDPMRYILN